MQTLLIATRNAHKTREIGQMLGSGWRVSDLLSFPHSPAMEETGATFEENAMLKALGISRVFTGLVLADDSGLEVDALGGAPGVRSARFAGGNANDAENRRALIELLKNLRGGELKARFRCVMVLATQGELLGSFEGTVEGKVIPEERGFGGFGYDSMFIPSGYSETFGELQPEIKNSLSHRGRALAKVLEFLRS
ncbi:MAG TPA: RdgB/HAM1 family non-canonical purine NTP pyrophosphatase [Chthoniobacterales bacterium]|jgi:XTP/dITP diphosphohydrolase|nr:RdgB/HAM1 family non-canonical purine NTP pyrophosphatase [Chthoniobacterales bacterium]